MLIQDINYDNFESITVVWNMKFELKNLLCMPNNLCSGDKLFFFQEIDKFYFFKVGFCF